MKSALFLMLFLFPFQWSKAQLNSDVNEIFSKKLEFGMISKGDNFPDFSAKQDSMHFLLVTLHENIPIEDFKNKTQFDDEKITEILSFLISKNWLHTIEGNYKPTIFVATDKDGKALYQYADPISEDIVFLLNERLPEIKEQFSKTEISHNESFEEWSFFILSDVLLDSWQIDHVEKDFLKQAQRPMRNGKYYYQSILENTVSGRESFGIYGNQMWTKDGRSFAIYGNNRYNNANETIHYHTVSKKDDELFTEMASSLLPDLLLVLEKHRTYSESVFEKLGYSKEISFEEFFIWWYHFIYTQATNKMADQKILQIPANGNFYYEMLQ